MATSRVKTSSILQGFPKSRSLLAGNTYFQPTSYESIQTTTVGSGGTATITFSSIPATFTHLQIRIMARLSTTTSGGRVTFNSDTGANYSRHYLYGTGASAIAGGNANASNIDIVEATLSSASASIFGINVIDILDYANTNKYKTLRSLAGTDINGTGGSINLYSGSWRNTAAISTITIVPQTGSYVEYSSFALYGIKGA
jgi:hypothetical protein